MELYVHAGMHVARWNGAVRRSLGESCVELHLQFGYGMMDHARSLVSAWGGATVLLSPRDLQPKQLTKLATEITAAGGRVLLDPQFYLPDADHGRLTSHEYWPDQYSTGSFWTGTELRGLLGKLEALNAELSCQQMILPGVFAPRVDDDWIARQAVVIDEARATTARPLLVTVALGAEAVRADADVDEVLAAAERWDVSGVYLVCEHPQGNYLVTDASWMANALDLAAGLRLKGLEVILGYSNHQMLAFASSGTNALASGTWMNVRSFPPEKFRAQYEDEIKQRAIWYYCPQALSEYKLPFLDIARKQGLLDAMAPPELLGSSHASPLFAGAQPTSVRWTEQAAFRHYLHCLHAQTTSSRAASFDDTLGMQERTLDAAEDLLDRLHSAGVRGQLRDFKESVDVNRAALSVLRSTRGAMLRRRWSSL